MSVLCKEENVVGVRFSNSGLEFVVDDETDIDVSVILDQREASLYKEFRVLNHQ